MDVIGFRMKDLRDAYQVTDNLGKPPPPWPGSMLLVFCLISLICKEPMTPPFCSL